MIRILLSTRLGERKWTQADLVRETGIRASTINDLYHEMTDRVSLEQLDQICKALDCDINEILVREEKIDERHTAANGPRPGAPQITLSLARTAMRFGLFLYTSVPSEKRNFSTSSAPRADAMLSNSSYLNFPVFTRWLNACGVVPILRASSASDILATASPILIFVEKSIVITSLSLYRKAFTASRKIFKNKGKS